MAVEDSGGDIFLIRAMDTLWFHRIILFSEPSLLLSGQAQKTSVPYSESLEYSSTNSSESSMILHQENSSDMTLPQEENGRETENECKTCRTRTTRSNSSSPVAHKKSRNLVFSKPVRRLQRTQSCKSLGELELEELKGFMDLGFVFKKENLSKRIMRLIPGLQRIDKYRKHEDKTKFDQLSKDDDDYAEEEQEDGNEEEMSVIRPYLSEAWHVRKPNSPFLNLKIPRVHTAADMKKQLKNWAKTVASVILQET